MGTITLTAGDGLGFVQGYARPDSAIAVALGGVSFGAISAEPLTSTVLAAIVTAASADAMYVQGETSPTLITSLTVNGVAWGVAWSAYDAGADETSYVLTPSGGEFVNGNVYTIVVVEEAPSASVFDVVIRNPGAAFDVSLSTATGPTVVTPAALLSAQLLSSPAISSKASLSPPSAVDVTGR